MNVDGDDVRRLRAADVSKQIDRWWAHGQWKMKSIAGPHGFHSFGVAAKAVESEKHCRPALILLIRCGCQCSGERKALRAGYSIIGADWCGRWKHLELERIALADEAREQWKTYKVFYVLENADELYEACEL
jgi:hypothetical protein